MTHDEGFELTEEEYDQLIAYGSMLIFGAAFLICLVFVAIAQANQ